MEATWVPFSELTEEDRTMMAVAAAKRRAILDEREGHPPDATPIDVDSPLNAHRIEQGGGVRVRLAA
ncbi:hypothetical protein WKW79_17395 [Variovorax robiniae]|uniref:Uncharacterized protein n=1 Tax=Variovorax robiniae TaxID=1836199 RepID=A0ABU8X9L0_9BURK